MDYDTDNSTTDSEESFNYYYTLVAVEIIVALICLIGIIFNCLIIYILVYFKRMRTVPNLFFLNWSICNTIFLFTTPWFYRAAMMLAHHNISYRLLCVIFELKMTMQLGTTLFVMYLSFDWYFLNYFPRTLERFRSFYKFYICSVWIFMLISSVSTITVLYVVDVIMAIISRLLNLAIICLSLLLLIIIIVTALIRLGKVRIKYLSTLILVIYYNFCWSILLFSLVFGGNQVLVLFMLAVAYLSSVFYVVVLFILNKEFKLCLVQLYKRVRGHTEAQNLIENGVTFNNETESDGINLNGATNT